MFLPRSGSASQELKWFIIHGIQTQIYYYYSYFYWTGGITQEQHFMLNMNLKVSFSRSVFQMVFSKLIPSSYKGVLRSGEFMWSAVYRIITFMLTITSVKARSIPKHWAASAVRVKPTCTHLLNKIFHSLVQTWHFFMHNYVVERPKMMVHPTATLMG